MNMLAFNLSALAALVPAVILGLPRAASPDARARGLPFWAVMAVAVAGTSSFAWALQAGGWQTGLDATLWVTIAAVSVLFAIGSALSAPLARLLPLLGPYLLLLGVAATISAHAPAAQLSSEAPDSLVGVHIVVSVSTYALLTLAAVAGLGVFLQERALKARKPNLLTKMLPAMTDGESLQRRLLTGAAVVLGLGLLTGMVVQFAESGYPLTFSHKTLFSILAFGVIAVLIAVERMTGLAGRRVARLVLLAYLLLTLAYPGVKFVTGLLLA